MLTQDAETIVYREKPLPLLLRLFALLLAVGLVTVVPAPFVIHADWTTPSSMWLLAILCIGFSASVGIAFAVIALVSATELRLDGRSGTATRVLRGPIVNRSDDYRLAEFGMPVVTMRESSDDGPFPILNLPLPGGRKVQMACFADRAEAECWRDRIAMLLSGGVGQVDIG